MPIFGLSSVTVPVLHGHAGPPESVPTDLMEVVRLPVTWSQSPRISLPVDSVGETITKAQIEREMN